MIRLLDILLSAVGLVLFLPFGLIVALVLRFSGEGEIFFYQERMGRDGNLFKMIKFATMLKNSPSIGAGEVTLKNDPRILPFGHFLRKTKINEVPQILNILKGDMSIVGPRPQTPKNFDYFPAEGKAVILSMRPGLTGIGSIVFRDEENLVAKSGINFDEYHRLVIGPYKAELEKWYRNHRNVITNIILIAVTVWVVFNSQSQIYRKIWPSLPSVPEILQK
jgi:lipopolysaccharide/colanic/teichoic acid biosynthesis glycosyltransferase